VATSAALISISAQPAAPKAATAVTAIIVRLKWLSIRLLRLKKILTEATTANWLIGKIFETPL
jgi:hypothetical protein